jgi:uncharacterized membrane protein YraQ (UPF0718 family)
MKKKLNPMIVPTVILGVIASVLLFYGYQKGSHIKGLNNAFVMIFSFIIAGMMQVLVSGEALLAWVGPEAGMKGIFLGTLAGAVTPGGPFVCLPLIAGFIHSGAGIGTMVAFITSWSIWAVMRLPLEIGILGLEFTLVRLASSALLPVIAGVFAQYFFSWVTIVQK